MNEYLKTQAETINHGISKLYVDALRIEPNSASAALGMIHKHLDDYVATIPVTPDMIAGLQLWLKTESLVGADGSDCWQWRDSSGYARNFGASGGSPKLYNNVVNGHAVLRDDGLYTAQLWGNVPGAQPITVFGVIKQTGKSVIATIFNKVPWFVRLNTSGFLEISAGTTVADATDHSGAFHCFAATFDGGMGRAWVDGAEVIPATSVGTTGFTYVCICADSNNTSPLDGDMAEFLIYNSALSDTDRQNVEKYLKSKFAL